MSLSGKNYADIYRLQDKVFHFFRENFGPFHLTGGTALGRFYLNHRYSDDIDLFTNQDLNYSASIIKLRQLLQKNFKISDDKSVHYQDYTRIWIEETVGLKIEFVNDVAERWGHPIFFDQIPVDTVSNILANKITALLSRDEPKDVFDIVSIALNYSYTWDEVFTYSLRKAIISEADVLMRLKTFPVELLEGLNWFKYPFDPKFFNENILRIADDFLLARENSLGKGKTPITEAKPKLIIHS